VKSATTRFILGALNAISWFVFEDWASGFDGLEDCVEIQAVAKLEEFVS